MIDSVKKTDTGADTVRVVPAERVAENHAMLVNLFRPIEQHDIRGFTAEDLVTYAESGTVIIFLARQGKQAWAMSIHDTGQDRIAELIAQVGKGMINDMPAYSPIIEQVCREQACNRVVLTGRPGLKKVMARHGFKLREVAMCREL